MFYDYSINHQQLKLGAIGCLLENSDGEKVHSYGFFLLNTLCLPTTLKLGLD